MCRERLAAALVSVVGDVVKIGVTFALALFAILATETLRAQDSGALPLFSGGAVRWSQNWDGTRLEQRIIFEDSHGSTAHSVLLTGNFEPQAGILISVSLGLDDVMVTFDPSKERAPVAARGFLAAARMTDLASWLDEALVVATVRTPLWRNLEALRSALAGEGSTRSSCLDCYTECTIEINKDCAEQCGGNPICLTICQASGALGCFIGCCL
jgi:hypothetical protein